MLSYSSVQFICSAVHVSLQPHGLKHARLPCPPPTPRACSQLCPSSQWCHPTISPSVILFSSCLQSFQASLFSYYFFLWLSHECFHCYCFLCCCNTFQLEFYRANNKGEKQNTLPSCTGLFQELIPRGVLWGVASLIKHSTNSDLVDDLKPRRQIYSEYHCLHRQFSDAAMPTLMKSWSRTSGHW